MNYLQAVTVDRRHLLIVVGGVVMKKIERLDPSIDGKIHRVDVARMAPTALALVVGPGVLRVMDENICDDFN